MKALVRFAGLMGALGIALSANAAEDGVFEFGREATQAQGAANNGGLEFLGGIMRKPSAISTDGRELLVDYRRSEWTSVYSTKPGIPTLHLLFTFYSRVGGEDPRFPTSEYLERSSVNARATIDEADGEFDSIHGYANPEFGSATSVDLFFDLPASTARLKTLTITARLVRVTKWKVIEIPNLRPKTDGSAQKFQIGELTGQISGTAEGITVFLSSWNSEDANSARSFSGFLSSTALGRQLKVIDADGVMLDSGGIVNGNALLFGPGILGMPKPSPQNPLGATGNLGRQPRIELEEIAFPVTISILVPEEWEIEPLSFTAEDFDLPPGSQVAP